VFGYLPYVDVLAEARDRSCIVSIWKATSAVNKFDGIRLHTLVYRLIVQISIRYFPAKLLTQPSSQHQRFSPA
jgi:hypothetical protein